MEDVKKYILGLISGISLMILGLDFIQADIGSIFMWFNPENIGSSTMFSIGLYIARGITIISVLGIFIVIYYAIRILAHILLNRSNS